MTPPLPERFQPARLHQVENLLPTEVGGSMGQVLWQRRDEFARAGDEDGQDAWFWWWPETEDRLADQLRILRTAILQTIPAAQECFGLEPFEPTKIAMEARLYHHGSHRQWHVESLSQEGTEGQPLFCAYYWLHSSPTMFTGGEVEFLAGDVIAARNNLLLFTDPTQMRRIRPVECWSSHVLHGLWSIVTWIGK